MAPYRSAPTPATGNSPRDRGIVGDIIEQFADPYAFLRELVQNAIDADTPDIEVEIAQAGPDTVRVAVRDRGVGMSRDVIENRLLVLFRSTKEKDDTKIGKFGVGFASVLAMQPTVVEVDSVHDGQRHVLHLYPDLSYELFDSGRAQQSGTAVKLELGLDADYLEQFVDTCRTALTRWCRHATVPISFSARDLAGGQLDARRIDRPLELDGALAQVQATSPDGRTSVVVGIARGALPYVGFFNHGLMLHETDEPLVGQLAVKIQDARLGHTLSRDNVRRDASFRRAVEFAGRVAERQLPAAAARALREAAASDERGRFADVTNGVIGARIALRPREWTFPLVEPLAGERTIDGKSFASGGGWVTGSSTELTRALASVGVPVVDLGSASAGARVLALHVQQVCGRQLRDVHTELVLVAPIEPTGADLAMLERLDRLLDEAYRKPEEIMLAEIGGPSPEWLMVTADSDDALFGAARLDDRAVRILHRDDAARDPFRLVGRGTVALNTRSVAIERARARAVDDANAAADLLVRVILLAHEKLDEGRSRRLLELGLDELLGEVE